MGKKQHQKDKLYLTTKEWKHEWGGYKGTQNTGENSRFRRLPFSCCSLSFQPFENPWCTKEGVIFDLMNIVPFLKKYGINPATGEKMSAKDLIRLNFHKNSEGKYHCPVTFKVFNENTHIVAIRPTGNVYCHDAVERLNVKTKSLKDLITDEPFTRKDIITIQDPTNLDKFNIQAFYYVRKNLRVTDEEEEKARRDPRFNLRLINNEAKSALDALEKEYTPSPYLGQKDARPQKADKFNAASYSTGHVAAAFTSTALDPETEHQAALIEEDVLRYERVRKKGYVRLMTSKGPLNVELHCDMVPRTCENFLTLCARRYYDGTVFHRSIRNFIIQGGDPAGTGRGGESAWGEAFKDELKPNLVHSGRGVLSMANNGPNTNKSQFFFTFRSARHLDGKHAVFGRLVGGLETLDAMEKVEVDKKDRPKEEIRIESCTIFVNPYEEADEQLAQEREEEAARLKAEEEDAKRKKREARVDSGPRVFKQGVGKYINSAALKRTAEAADDTHPNSSDTSKKRKTGEGTAAYKLSDFSAW
ncbi:RING-type E3 ubiquitin-protein ligase PPIL2-like [Babylonia areolata]|uniref:RING-type E3 ubiquitin-protein ligase PPIL2-like n=1 Tax=Babylonia areolata TaxID=304850 RepID=UPI003FD64DA2